MREISIFKMDPVFVMGGDDNLLLLQKKIKEDEVILNQIEQDYKKNQSEFKQEYLTAKINYLRNNYFYCWLFLKTRFEQAYGSESFFPDYQKEEMKKHGWMLPQFFINKRIITSGDTGITTEELYIRNIDKLFDELFGFSIGDLGSRMDSYYKQAIYNYHSRNYYSCAVSLFPIIESYHQHMTRFDEDSFYRIKDNLDKVDKQIENIKQIFSIKIEYYIDLVKQFDDLAENHYFKKSLSRKNEPEIINRNRIMHGLFSREISQKDCLQLFCTLSNMVTIATLIEASEAMDKFDEEIKALEEANS